MEIDLLLTTMTEQSDNLERLLNVLTKMQTAIIQNNIDDFELTVESEDKLLKEIKKKEQTRTEQLKTVLNVTDLPVQGLNEKVIEVVSKQDKKKVPVFKKLRENLILKVSQVELMNVQTNYLINHSRRFIKDLITGLLGNSNRNILDRKV